MILRDVTTEWEMQRLKDEFLTAASHELRAPAASIKTLTGVLLRILDKQGAIEPAHLKKRLQTIQREADRLALLSGDLLDVSRLQVGKLAIQPEPADLNALVISCVAKQQAQLVEAHQPAFLLRLVPGTVPVRVERGRVAQVITNLLDNAVKYSFEDGEIAVATWVEGAWARLAIADQGIGIPANELDKIFTPPLSGN
jgi:signal transduction histidine kinase